MKLMYTKIRYFAFALGVCCLASCAKPIAEFTSTRATEKAPSEVKFENESKKATEYKWDFGDGNISDDISPVHEYRQSGNYEVTLIARNEKGKSNTKQARIMVKPPEKCLVEIQTEFGDMVVELFDGTPQHRDNFFKLADEGFYDELLFHRVIDGFMIQGGDPQSKDAQPGQPLGAGGPGYQVPAEIKSDYIHVKGALAAARQGDNVNPYRKSSGSQFYIVHGKPLNEEDLKTMERRTGWTYTDDQKAAYLKHGGTPFLDGQYTVFGRVISGLEVVDKIAAVKGDAGNRPQEDVKMKMITIK